MRIKFDFGDLDAFLAVSEFGSFQRAAEHLHISQSALTRRIQKLEDAMGIELIERTTRSVKLTLAAKSFRSRAQSMVDEAAEAMRALGDESLRFEHQRNAVVTVAAVPTATHNILPSAIKLFREQGYSARIRLLDMSANDVLEAVSQGEADFGINFIGAQEPSLTFRAILDDRFVLALNRSDRLSRKKKIKWSEVDDNRFITVWKGSGNRMLIDSALAKARQSMNWAYEVRHLSTALGLVEAGIGITALPQSAMPAEDHPLLISRPLIEPDVSRTIGTVRRTGGALPAVAESFYDAILERWSSD